MADWSLADRLRTEWPVAVALLVCFAVVALVVEACNDLEGGPIEVSAKEAEAEIEEVLGLDVPSPVRVVEAHEHGWAPTDGPHYGYTVEFDSTSFASFFEQWSVTRDSLFWSHFDSENDITHDFEMYPEKRQLRYFHADH